MGPRRPTSRRGFDIAIFCALPLEADAVRALFDNCWDDEGPPFGRATGDHNSYTNGSIGHHNVVLVHLPGMGKINAAAAVGCRITYPEIKLAIVAGICGGVPLDSAGREIILGDVIVSTGVVEYDFRQRRPDLVERRDALLHTLGRPNVEIRSVLNKLKGIHPRRTMQKRLAGYLNDLQSEPDLEAEYPGAIRDRLFEPTYRHRVDGQTCDVCHCGGPTITRHRLSHIYHDTEQKPEPMVHFGLVGSDDVVMKSGGHRDIVAQREGIIAFEMEAAGVWDHFPCIVIKGVSDYADSHKVKSWQRYAAATAAACVKAFLDEWAPSSSLTDPEEAVVSSTADEKENQPSQEKVEGTISTETPVLLAKIDDLRQGLVQAAAFIQEISETLEKYVQQLEHGATGKVYLLGKDASDTDGQHSDT